MAYTKHLKTLQLLKHNLLKLNLSFEDLSNSIY